MPIKRRLNNLLLESGVITPEDIELVINHQQTKNIQYSKALIDLGYISDVKLLALMSEIYNLPTKRLGEVVVDTEVIENIPRNLIQEYRFLPIAADDNSIDVLMDDTVNLIRIDDVEQILGKKLNIYLIREVEYEKLVDKYLNHTKIIEDLTDIPVEEMITEVVDVTVDVENSPVSKAVNSYLKQGYLMKASDIHFDITDKEMLVRYRVDGDLLVAHRLPKSSANYIVARLKLLSGLNTTDTRMPQDGSVQIMVNKRVVDLRISVVPAMFGEKVVIRILDNEKNIRDIETVDFSKENIRKIKNLVRNPVGMILVTGPTGSGKSTLLYTFIHHVMSDTKNIITIEDPVEYKLPNVTQITVNTASGLTFPVGLRSILRQDPDIILVGEIRDELTAEIAVKASNTGHLVFTTLHTNSSVSSITRLSEMGVEPYLVAGSAIGVINQRLVRRLCNDCKKPYMPEETTENMEHYGLQVEDGHTFYQPVGCESCNGVGYSGRIPIHEVLEIDEELKALISEKKGLKEIEKAAIERGMITLREDGIQKVLQGVTTLDELRKQVG